MYKCKGRSTIVVPTSYYYMYYYYCYCYFFF